MLQGLGGAHSFWIQLPKPFLADRFSLLAGWKVPKHNWISGITSQPCWETTFPTPCLLLMARWRRQAGSRPAGLPSYLDPWAASSINHPTRRTKHALGMCSVLCDMSLKFETILLRTLPACPQPHRQTSWLPESCCLVGLNSSFTIFCSFLHDRGVLEVAQYLWARDEVITSVLSDSVLEQGHLSIQVFPLSFR